MNTQTRRALIVGNWKMNGSTAANRQLLADLLARAPSTDVECAVCAPAPYLAQCRQLLEGSTLKWGGQDCSTHAGGARTGEVSAHMLADLGCRYVIVGHSERRSFHAESSQAVAAKTVAALSAGLRPIVCVGETLAQRDAGKTMRVVSEQLGAVCEAVPADLLARLVLAYEPVWAIGTGKTATPAMAQEVHAHLRAHLDRVAPDAAARVPILYGGSMKPDNARELLAQPDIDGGLIGAASLNAGDFLAIAGAA